MTMAMEDEAPEDDLGPSTAPGSFGITARGFAAEEEARRLGTEIGDAVRAFGHLFDLTGLDGVTVAHDYAQSLAELDRGYATSYKLAPSEGHAVGVAMTPSVLRDGTLKSHIVFNAPFVTAILDPEHENFPLAMHLIAHECAHVEVTRKFDEAFPGVLLRSTHADARAGFRWQVIMACWDEYAATNLSARIGEDPTDKYEETLLKQMAEAREVANTAIRAYRLHGQVGQVYAEVYGTYGELLKFAAYFLGTLDGQKAQAADRKEFSSQLSGHWFEPYFYRLHDACKAIAANYGGWPDKAVFEAIGNIADDLVSAGGVSARYLTDGRLYLDVSFAAETMPRFV